MSTPGAEVRRRAALAIHAVRFCGSSMKAALPQALEGLLDSRDRALCEAMVFAACRWMHRYEDLLNTLLQRPLAPRQAPIHALLLAGLAQLDALQLPAHAALSATAEAARLLRQPGLVGLVNAVLRRFQREQTALLAQQDGRLRHSHPDWLQRRLASAWPENHEQILAANNRPAGLWLRVQRQRVEPAALLQRWQAAGIDAELEPRLPAALRLRARIAPTQLPGWEEGAFAVQDGAAQACVLALDLQPGQRVLDACAAPGGKTAAIFEYQPELDLLALDNAADRVQRMRSGLARLGHRPRLRCADAADPAVWSEGQTFDRILVDAPCSGTGVIRRQPDIKWHRRESDIQPLLDTQARLLDALWPRLAPDGVLLYTTCSILPEENAEQATAFLHRHPDARAQTLPELLGRPAGPGRQRLPGEDDWDGFYYAAFRRGGG